MRSPLHSQAHSWSALLVESLLQQLLAPTSKRKSGNVTNRRMIAFLRNLFGSSSSSSTSSTSSSSSTSVTTMPIYDARAVNSSTGTTKSPFMTPNTNKQHILPIQGLVGDPVAVAFRQAKMADDVVAYLLKDFNHTYEELCNLPIFHRNSDHPDVPGHIYFEASYHCCDTTEPIMQMHPRFGVDVEKPAAPDSLRNFAIAFRELNDSWLSPIVSKGQPMENMIPFSDAAIQIHAGDVIEPGSIGFHFDAENSVIHMALSLNGRRVLHVIEAQSSVHGDRSNDLTFEQVKGDLYVSSPYAVCHGVEYAEAKNWNTRVVAIQLRFGMTKTDRVRFRDVKSTSWHEQMLLVADVLSNAKIIVPTLADIKS